MQSKLDKFMVDAGKLLEAADTLGHNGLFDDDIREGCPGYQVRAEKAQLSRRGHNAGNRTSPFLAAFLSETG